ncbi:MAG TPA: YfiR family protein [Verrucomicrobiae bacterium]|nr:YfiR family protein [Verrucomicrobiae bacterium]
MRPRFFISLFARSWRLIAALLCGGALLGVGNDAGAEQLSAQEYAVKAAYLFNFVKFVEWPPTAFSSPEEPFVIGVMGESPFGDVLERVIHNKKLNDHPLVLRQYKRGDDLKGCHLVFVSRSEKDHFDEIAQALKGGAVLLVGEEESFLSRGGMINFFVESDTVKFSINLPAAEGAGLKISSKLLNVARLAKKAAHFRRDYYA